MPAIRNTRKNADKCAFMTPPLVVRRSAEGPEVWTTVPQVGERGEQFRACRSEREDEPRLYRHDDCDRSYFCGDFGSGFLSSGFGAGALFSSALGISFPSYRIFTFEPNRL